MYSNKNAEGAEYLGLLLNHDGTVCDDGFSNNSADAICRKMGYAGYTHWTSGKKLNIQPRLSITLDDVSCSSGNWSSCRYTFSHNCSHMDDVFLQCYTVG